MPIPLLSLEYKDIVYIDIVRAGAYVLSSSDKKMGLGVAGEPRWGYRAGNGARLTGMKRRTSIELGPSFDWDAGMLEMNIAYFRDVTGASRGGSVHAAVHKQLVKTGHLELGAMFGLDYIDGSTANYYFGVTPGEARPGRAAYVPGPSTSTLYGMDGSYRLSPGNSVVFGFIVTRLSGAAASSPIVERRYVPWAWLGYAWNFGESAK
jgi:outer membrane protein